MTNEELAIGSWDGSQRYEAFDIIHSRLQRGLNIFVKKMVLEKEIAEEIVQETWMRVYQNLKFYNPRYKVSTWIYTIARNLSINYLRRNKRRRYTSLKNAENMPGPNRENESNDYSGEDIKKAIAELPKMYGDVINCRFLEAMSYEETARILGIPLGTVKSRVFRGLPMLRQNLLEKIT